MSDDLSGFSLLELFRTEVDSQTAALSEGVLALERGESAATVAEPLMRAAHSLKGAARIVGVEPAERVAHALEDVFVAAQKNEVQLTSNHVDGLLRAVDLLGEMAKLDEAQHANWRESHGSKIDESLATLRAILTGEGPEPPPSKPAGKAPQAKATPSKPAGKASQAKSKEPESAERTKPRRTRRRRSEPKESPDRAQESPDRAQPEPPPTIEPVSVSESEPVSSVPAASEPVVTPKGPAPANDSSDRVVRVTAENLSRLMGLAGESVVEARQLRPSVDSLGALKEQQGRLWEILQEMEGAISSQPGSEAAHLSELLAKAKQAAGRCSEGLGERLERLERHARRNEDLAERLHHEVISSRLRPLIDGVRGFPRMVRDIARQLGKKVRFEILGERTGVDRDILEKLEAPLNHLIRNALDHGVELPEERAAAGKDPTATVQLDAHHVAGMLQITLRDDGRGIDPERLRLKVIERGMTSPEVASQLTETELLEFLFLSGFTTTEKLTDLSGRGVGLDVVQSMVHAVGGGVRVASRLGEGTTFTLQLPITMSVIRALLVQIGGQPYAFPLSRLDRIASVRLEAVEVIEGRQFFQIDEQAIGLVSATEVMELPSIEATGETLSVVVISDRGHCFGIVVEAFLGERDLDVRPIDHRLGKVPNINSASVLDDGWPVLIIDVEDLVRSIDNLLSGRRLRSLRAGDGHAADRKAPKQILVVDDSITVRELERQLLESRGFAVDVAVDGMDGWNSARSGHYDLIVSDVDMPRMDGIQFVTLVKRDPRLRNVPIVIVSYKDREEDRLRGLDVGADFYLTKSSFHDETFLNAVVDLIGEAVE